MKVSCCWQESTNSFTSGAQLVKKDSAKKNKNKNDNPKRTDLLCLKFFRCKNRLQMGTSFHWNPCTQNCWTIFFLHRRTAILTFNIYHFLLSFIPDKSAKWKTPVFLSDYKSTFTMNMFDSTFCKTSSVCFNLPSQSKSPSHSSTTGMLLNHHFIQIRDAELSFSDPRVNRALIICCHVRLH